VRLRADRLPTRISGTAVGVGFCLLGLYAVLGVGAAATEVARDRALWYGLTSMLIGVIAVVASWVVRNVDEVWCRPPRRSWNR